MRLSSPATGGGYPEAGKKQPPSTVGKRVAVNVQGAELQGTVRFSGKTSFAEGDWFGIELDRPNGNSNGAMGGISYFDCAPKKGLFVRPHMARPLTSDNAGSTDQHGKMPAPSSSGKSFGSVFHHSSDGSDPAKSLRVQSQADKSFGSVFHHPSDMQGQDDLFKLQVPSVGNRMGSVFQDTPTGDEGREAIEDLRAENRELQAKLKDVATVREIEELRAENRLLQSQLQEKKNVEEAANQLRTECDKMKQEFTTLKEQRQSEWETEMEATKAELSSLRSEKDSLNAKVLNSKAFEEAAKQLQQKCTNQEMEITNLLKLQLPDADDATRQAIAKERGRKPALLQDPQLSDFQATVASLQSTATVLQNKFAHEQELVVLRDAVLKLQKEKKQLREQADRLPPLRKLVIELQQQSQDEAQEFDRLLDEVAKLQGVKDKLLRTEAELQKTRQDLQTQLQETRQGLQAQLQDTRQNSQDQLQDARRTIEDLRKVNQTLLDAQGEFGSKDKHCSQLLDQVSELQKENYSLKATVDKLTPDRDRADRLQKDVTSLRAKVASLEEEIQAKDKAAALLRQAVEHLQNDNQAAHAHKQELHEQLMASRVAAADLRKNADAKDRLISQHQEALAAAKVSS